jgi:undecaprenyl-diphosphatase
VWRGVLAVTTVTFVALALAVVLTDRIAADATLREAVLGLASPALVAVMRVVNRAGDWKVLLPATMLLVLGFDRARRTWWVWVALMIAAPALEGALKEVVARPRPEGSAFGFPSGHATAVAAYAGAVLYLASDLPRRAGTAVRALAVMVMLAVGVARIVLRAHWPSDVLAGFALGLALASIAAMAATARAGTDSPRRQPGLRAQ